MGLRLGLFPLRVKQRLGPPVAYCLLVPCTLQFATDSGNTFSVRVQHKPKLTSFWSSSQFLVFFIQLHLLVGLRHGTVSPTGKTASGTACGFLFAYSTFSSVLYAHDIRFQFLFGSTRFLVRRSARLHLRPDLTPFQGPISDHGYV